MNKLIATFALSSMFLGAGIASAAAPEATAAPAAKPAATATAPTAKKVTHHKKHAAKAVKPEAATPAKS